MNSITRKPAHTVTELASARQHQETGRPLWSARWRVRRGARIREFADPGVRSSIARALHSCCPSSTAPFLCLCKEAPLRERRAGLGWAKRALPHNAGLSCCLGRAMGQRTPRRRSAGVPPAVRRRSAGGPPAFRTRSAPMPHRYRTGAAPVPHRCRTGSAPVPHRCRTGAAAIPQRIRTGVRKQPGRRKKWVFPPRLFWSFYDFWGVFVFFWWGGGARRRRAAHPPAFRT